MYKRRIVILLLCLFSIFLWGCGNKKQQVNKTLFAMDTVMTLELYGKNTDRAYKEMETKILELEKNITPHSKDSMIGRLNSDKKAQIDEDVICMLETAAFYAEKTNGALDISTFTASEEWGFGKETQRVPDAKELEALKETIDYKRIQVSKDYVTIGDNMTIGLGAVAKGYTADVMLDIAKKYELDYALINLGGNIACYGSPLDADTFGIGLEDPHNPGTALAVIQTTDCSVVSSGNYQRYFEQDGKRYHHIIDPKTAAPAVTDVNMITVVCDSSISADCLSTSLYVMGEERTIDFWRKNKELFDFVMVKDGELLASSGLKDRLGLLSDMELKWIDG